VSFQIIQKASEPRISSARVGPNFDVFRDSLKDRAAQLECGIHSMERRGPLQIEGTVVFGQHVLAIGFLAHFNVGDRVGTFLEVSHLRRRVFGRAVEHRNGNDGGESARDAAGEEQVEAGLVTRLHAVRRNV
jgi:hypothetical protein